MISVLLVVCETIICSNVIPEISHMGRVHEPWGNVIEPLLLNDYCTYEGKSLNKRNFIIIFTRVLIEIVCVLFFDIVPLLRNTLGPLVHKLADAL